MKRTHKAILVDATEFKWCQLNEQYYFAYEGKKYWVDDPYDKQAIKDRSCNVFEVHLIRPATKLVQEGQEPVAICFHTTL